MPLIRVQHQFNHKSGLATDVSINTFYILGPGSDLTGMVGIKDAIIGFYENTVTGGNTLTMFLHTAAMSTDNRHTIKCYDMSTAPPRVPFYEFSDPGEAAAGTGFDGLPHEVAICLSYKSTPQSGLNAKRRRGRIYVGPLNLQANEDVAPTNVTRPADAMINTLLLAGVELKSTIGAVGYEWVGFSPTTANPAFPVIGEAGMFPIDILSVDNSFDTQRRRGEARTAVSSATV